MKELHEILKKIDSLAPGENAVLATVVDVKGSSYRLPGAKMLILENGDSFGTVSGGCLEADVMERAGRVLETGESQIFTYDTTTNEDSVFSFNMGCRGVIRILLETITNNSYVGFLRDHFENGRGVVATLINPNNGDTLGERYFFDEENIRDASFQNKELLDAGMKVLGSGVSRLETFEFGEVFLEYIAPPVQLKLFGAGADAVPLALISKNLGWHVTVIDHREALANDLRFENPDQIVHSRPENILSEVILNAESIAVVMTHNFDHDKEIIKNLFATDVKYIGLLGPKARTESLLRELKESGAEISSDDLKRLHAPIGLDIGGQLPEMIAVAIIAEIQATIAGRNGGFLRDRTGSIYDRGS
ncbi:MAG: XdhC/CoxI family protein [Pyrinomonadaceae bacterium]